MHKTLAFLLGASLLLSPLSCSRQKEGERCSRLNADADCESGLVCTLASQLRSSDIDRCCPDAGSYSDVRCAPVTGSSGDGDGDGDGAGGAGGSSDGQLMSTEEADLNLGAVCQFHGTCDAPLICSPGGTCDWECRIDRDCLDGKICSETDRRCVEK